MAIDGLLRILDVELNESRTGMHFIFVHGFPGVGKFTVGTRLEQDAYFKGRFKFFHNHLVIDSIFALFDYPSPPFVKLRELHWLQIFEEAFKQKLYNAENYDKYDGIIFTFGFEYSVSDTFLPNLVGLVNKYKVRLTFIELLCSRDILLNERVCTKERKEKGKWTDKEFILNFINEGKIKSGHDYITNTLNLRNNQIDTNGKTPDETVNIIVDKFKNNLL